MEPSDQSRYIEYFQRQLLREGSESFWHGQQDWFEENRSKFAEKFLSISKTDGEVAKTLSDSVLAHKSQYEYDDFFSKLIFEPLVLKALGICKEGGFPLNNPIKLVDSPAFEPSPAALPSSSEHLLFAGQGTYVFCNYWSKIFSSAVAEVSSLSSEEKGSPEALLTKLKEGNVLLDAARLSVHYAYADSLVGFGRLEQAEELMVIRALLVSAMEIFVIGHEIGHFLSHEAHPDTQGIRPGLDLKSHELECDAIGISITSAYGAHEKNAFAYTLIGPLLFFYALRTCTQVKAILLDEKPVQSVSHPEHEDRFRYVLSCLDMVEDKNVIMKDVTFFMDVAMCIGSQVQLIAYDLKTNYEAR